MNAHKRRNAKYSKEDIANAEKALASLNESDDILTHLCFAREDLRIAQMTCKSNKAYEHEAHFIKLSAELLDYVIVCLTNRVNDCRGVLGKGKLGIKMR